MIRRTSTFRVLEITMSEHHIREAKALVDMSKAIAAEAKALTKEATALTREAKFLTSEAKVLSETVEKDKKD